MQSKDNTRPMASESVEQICLFRWANGELSRHPELEFMYHVPNGGHRSKTTAAKLKMEGVKSGVPDVTLPVARGGYHGLYIELKVKKNKPTENQKKWIEALKQNGYFVVVCYGWVDASEKILEYLGL